MITLHKRLWKLILVIEIVFMVFWPWSKDHSLENELNFVNNKTELMAKTIRSHPTSPFILPEPIFWITLIFSKFGPNMDLRFLHFPTSLQVKRLAPKGKQMRMDHPFILGFCQNLTLCVVSTIIFQLLRQNPLSSITVLFWQFCVSPIQIWETPNYYYF